MAKDFLDESTDSMEKMQKSAKDAIELPEPVGGKSKPAGPQHHLAANNQGATRPPTRPAEPVGGKSKPAGPQHHLAANNQGATRPPSSGTGGDQAITPVGPRSLSDSAGRAQHKEFLPEPSVEARNSAQIAGANDQRPAQTSTPRNTPVGWGDDRPEFLPEMPENMPGPTEWEVTEDQTVAGQLENNLSKDSPLFEVLQESAQTNAARRGLKNSLMALTAGELATVSKAFEISSQDAATFARSAEFNAITANQFSQAEQAFMHSAMLSEQNFRQASRLQQEQIQGAIDQISAEIRGRSRLAEQQQDHWLQQSGVMHAQNLESMELNHVLDVERLGVVQDYNLESMAFQTESQMALAGFNSDLQAALMDRQFMQNLQLNEQQFGMQQSLQYQQQVFGMLQTELAMIGQIGSGDLTPEQMQHAIGQLRPAVTENINLMATFFNANGGPAAQSGIGGSPYHDYLSYHGSPAASSGGYGGATGQIGGGMSLPDAGGGAT